MPIIGETFQCVIGNLQIYIEQTVAKPPTSNIYCISPNYKIYGYITTNASTGANSIKAVKTGKFIVEFNDGIRHEIYFPQVHIKGTTVGKRTFNYKHVAMVCDKANNLASFINFNPDAKGLLASIFSSKQKTYPDTFK
jgi:hypothetical protein